MQGVKLTVLHSRDNGGIDANELKVDAFVKSPKNAFVIPRSLRRGISTIRNHTS
jgi:hypothetical protein